MTRGYALLCFFFSFIPSLHADQIQTAYLQLTEIEPEIYQVLWKVPATSEQRLSLEVVFDNKTKTVSNMGEVYLDNAYIRNWSIHRKGGIETSLITIQGMKSSAVEVLVRIAKLNKEEFVHRISAAEPVYRVPEAMALQQTFQAYFLLGVKHILIGIDHLLFIIVLMLLVKELPILIWTITSFTLAHSITLSLSTLGVLILPAPPVEACIALSIVFVVCEILRHRRGIDSLTTSKPWLMAFIFGLLHGLGFAAVLMEIGLPTSAIPMALLSFNIGVEVGQLVFIGTILAISTLIIPRKIAVAFQVSSLPLYAIGTLATFWTIERTVSFWL